MFRRRWGVAREGPLLMAERPWMPLTFRRDPFFFRLSPRSLSLVDPQLLCGKVAALSLARGAASRNPNKPNTT